MHKRWTEVHSKGPRCVSKCHCTAGSRTVKASTTAQQAAELPKTNAMPQRGLAIMVANTAERNIHMSVKEQQTSMVLPKQLMQ